MRQIVAPALAALLLSASAATLQAQTDPGPVSMSGLFYLAYEHGEMEGVDYSGFAVNRSYLAASVKILPRLSARITLDGHQDDTGDMKVRLKYAHAKYDLGTAGPLSGLNIEAGIAHMVWLGFEEHINAYRMREKMFMERSGLFNSADFGVTLAGNLGGKIDQEYQETVSSSEAGRWGSFAVGVYNGGGYHAIEMNENRAVQGRLTVRPLPDVLPGLQVSGLAIASKGNQPDGEGVEAAPDWNTYNLFLSYQHRNATLTAQYVDGRGNQKGSFTEPDDPSMATEYTGYSLFGEAKQGPWRFIAEFDDFNRKPGSADLSFIRYHAGIGYDLGGGNILLLDVDRRDWDVDARPSDTRAQVVMQVKF